MRIGSISRKKGEKKAFPRNINEPISCSIFVLPLWNLQKSIPTLIYIQNGHFFPTLELVMVHFHSNNLKYLKNETYSPSIYVPARSDFQDILRLLLLRTEVGDQRRCSLVWAAKVKVGRGAAKWFINIPRSLHRNQSQKRRVLSSDGRRNGSQLYAP